MNSYDKITIKTKIKNGDEVEELSVISNCTTKFSTDDLMEFEYKDNESNINNVIKLFPIQNKIIITKSLNINCTMIFNVGKTTSCVYKTIYGITNLGIKTNKIEINKSKTINIFLDYDMFNRSDNTLLGNYNVFINIK